MQRAYSGIFDNALGLLWICYAFALDLKNTFTGGFDNASGLLWICFGFETCFYKSI